MLGETVSPKEIHDRCELSGIDLNVYSFCTLVEGVETTRFECSTGQCGGQKQVCDCNVYR